MYSVYLLVILQVLSVTTIRLLYSCQYSTGTYYARSSTTAQYSVSSARTHACMQQLLTLDSKHEYINSWADYTTSRSLAGHEG